MENNDIKPSGRVVLIGAGMVGATAAYSLINKRVCREIHLIDIANELVKSQVLDLQDATNLDVGIKVFHSNYQDISDGDVVVITAGAAQLPGQSRSELLASNSGVMNSIFKELELIGKNIYVLMVSNPVDILTHLALEQLNLPTNQIFGSGTVLDTGRLRGEVAEIADVSPINVHAYVLGEHGDSSFPAISAATIAGQSLAAFAKVRGFSLDDLQGTVRDRAYRIIEGKQATYYGIATAITNICRAVISNQRRIFTLSVPVSGNFGLDDVCLSVPVQLGNKGYEFIGEAELDETELRKLHSSAKKIKQDMINLSSK